MISLKEKKRQTPLNLLLTLIPINFFCNLLNSCLHVLG